MDIALSGVHKRYTYKTVLSGISMDFPGGKIHALLGENGAGKSTTAAILSGSLQPDAGTVRINGVPVTLKNERDAVRRGIVMVRQRPLLADSITVRENIVLGSEYGAETHRWNKKARQAEIAALLARLNPPLTAKTLAADLGGDSRFYTAFIAALIRRPQVLLLDEPSALLDWEQRRQLYAYIRELSQSGMNVIIITHSREEAALYTDTVTVLAEGMVAARYADSSTYVPSEPIMQNKAMAGSIFGSNVYKPSVAVPNRNASLTITYEHITVRPKNRPALFDVQFSARSGAITLIAGQTESGLATLEQVITGLEQTKGCGTVTISAGDVCTRIPYTPRRYTAALLRTMPELRAAIVPTDRTFRAAHPQLTIEQLLTALYDGAHPAAYADRLIADAGVNITRTETVSALSGGMLQRLILARELDRMPRLIIFCEPLQGLDTYAAENVCALIARKAREGAAVIVLSAAGFPEALCAIRYRLDGGRLFPTDTAQRPAAHTAPQNGGAKV